MHSIIQKSTGERTEFLDITRDVEAVVSDSGVGEGILLVYTKHTTTGLTINENEKGLIMDMERILGDIVSKAEYMHDRIDNNADAHLRSLILGQHLVLPVFNGRIELGVWQKIFFVELDGPRTRDIVVEVIEG